MARVYLVLGSKVVRCADCSDWLLMSLYSVSPGK